MGILVTGGAGFIGSNFVHHLLNNYSELEVVVIDKLTYAGNLKNLDPLLENPRLRFIEGCISDYDLINPLIESIDFIVNFASESHVDTSISNPLIFAKTNVEGVLNLLEIVVRNKKCCFIQISTDEVYGASNDGDFKKEDSLLKPGNPYAASKASAEMFVLAYANTHKINYKILRLTNNYGPRQHPEKLIPKTITHSINNKKIPLYGAGLQERDWLYVDDSCRAIEKVMFEGKVNEIYNVSTETTKRNIEVVNQILHELKKENLIEHVKDRLGHDKKYLIDSQKIKQELQWNPKIEFNEGIRETIKWYKDCNYDK